MDPLPESVNSNCREVDTCVPRMFCIQALKGNTELISADSAGDLVEEHHEPRLPAQPPEAQDAEDPQAAESHLGQE